MAFGGIIIGLVTLFVVGYAIIKGKYAPLVLFLSGIFMLICSVMLGTTGSCATSAHFIKSHL